MDNPESRPLAGTPWLFGATGMGVLFFAAALAANAGALEVVFVAGSLLLVGLVARGWSHFALRRLRYRRGPSFAHTTVRAFCGETITFETSLLNRKPLPLGWIEVWERFPTPLTPRGDDTERSQVDPRFVWLSQGAALWPYQRARWQHEVECTQRGVYSLPFPHLRGGDPFGLLEREGLLACKPFEVIVYPRVVRLRRLALSLRHPALDAAGARSLVADPTRTLALRDYQPGDPQRIIHWPTTARRGSLQVRIPEPATSLRTYLVVDVRGFQSPWTLYRETLLELTLSAVASVAVHLHQNDIPVGLLANTEPGLDLPPTASPAGLQVLLEALARLQVLPSQPLLPWVSLRLPGRTRGTTVILATSDASPEELAETLAQLEADGHQVVLLVAGRLAEAGAVLGSQQLIYLSPECDLASSLEGMAA